MPQVKTSEVDGLTTNERYKAHLRKLPLPQRRALFLDNLCERVQRQRSGMASWGGDEMGDVRRQLDHATTLLKAAAAGLRALPASYRSREGVPRQSHAVDVQPGDVVSIAQRSRPEYDGVFEPEQLDGIRVVEVRGNKLLGLLAGDVRAMIPLGHVQAH